MGGIRGLVKTRYSKIPNRDEFYTLPEEVEYLFNNFDEDFTDKIIYCPFDGEQSEFVKYIKKNKDKLKYKEFLYTSDDFKNHLDLFKKADYIISNPPFSQLTSSIIPFLKNLNKPYFLFCNLCSTSFYLKRDKDLVFYPRKGYKFKFKDGSLKSVSSVCYVTKNFKVKIKKREVIRTKLLKDLINSAYLSNPQDFNLPLKNFIVFDKLKDIPKDFTGECLVPVSIYLSDLKYTSISYDHTFDGKREKYTDNKVRFLRAPIILH